jgi:hypothetical protein
MAMAASAAGAGISAFSSIMSGRAQSRALSNEAVQYDAQARGVDLQAMQSSERRREDLRASFAAITAQRAAKGLSLDTPSAVAIENEIRRQAVRDEGVEKLGYLNQSSSLRASARARRRGASAANMGGYLNAAGTLMSAAGDLGSAMGGGGGGASKMLSGKGSQKLGYSL